MDLKKCRGQYFTTNSRLLRILVSLIHNNGSILEPSAGSGHIIKEIENSLKRPVVGCELDESKVFEKVCSSSIFIENFFSFIKKEEYYSTVIGNPPFVKLKNVEEDTVLLLPEKILGNGNLYYYFIKYAVKILEDNGELIYIVPKEWLYNTSAQFVRNYLYENGNFTHFIDCGENKLFEDASVPSLCIFRFQRSFSGNTKYYNSLEDYENNNFIEKTVFFGDTISFSENSKVGVKISDIFDIKVGLVTGCEEVFRTQYNHAFESNCIVKIMTTSKTLSSYIFVDKFNNIDDIPPMTKNHLLSNKEILKKRKIKLFNEKNWWKYGAIRNLELMKSDKKRIYGLMKTRDDKIFWVGDECSLFGGGVFGLFIKDGIKLDLIKLVDYLNSDDFKKIMRESNMYSNNKVSITPKAFGSLYININ